MYPIGDVTLELNDAVCHTPVDDTLWPILICLLGDFRVLKGGHPISLNGGKAEHLLRCLGLEPDQPVPRDMLLETMWPGHPPDLAGQSLNSLTYSLRKMLGDEIGGDTPVVHEDGYYRLNQAAGVGVDVTWFENLIKAGDHHMLSNNLTVAVSFYTQAARLYRGDLCAGTDIHCVMVRERLRAHFLTILAHLADYCFATEDYGRCLHYADQLLKNDACREDAHRLVMRCYVRRGERAQALRQYRLCVDILYAEFDAVPEQQTVQLYDQVRLTPHTV
ncbi:MAG TPA: BTAD domain-containing putative transcriptional regulator [Chloroflexota bacterium]|nr:BTAD domain-containing putative transcriptional regulator [Chloroflexota bacterium]HUM69956.1 BTAD domain-containing putative transcriptional regulator [Chloroflexota bacterium]